MSLCINLFTSFRYVISPMLISLSLPFRCTGPSAYQDASTISVYDKLKCLSIYFVCKTFPISSNAYLSIFVKLFMISSDAYLSIFVKLFMISSDAYLSIFVKLFMISSDAYLSIFVKLFMISSDVYLFIFVKLFMISSNTYLCMFSKSFNMHIFKTSKCDTFILRLVCPMVNCDKILPGV